MTVHLKRAYDDEAADDGYRVLVDRLWPRGIKKVELEMDAWMRPLSPSNELRKWYEHDPAKWDEFRERYRKELSNPEAEAMLSDLAARSKHGTVTLLYASKAQGITNADALKEFIEEKAKTSHGAKAGAA